MDLTDAKTSRIPFVPGTKPSIKNSQLLASSGIPSLDHIIGGGLPVGSLFLIEEDLYATYTKIMLKYFIAEGVVTTQPLFVGSKNVDVSEFVSDIPAVITDNTQSNEESFNMDEQMKIAWRYQNMKMIDTSTTGAQPFGHFYNLTKKMEKETLERANITKWQDNNYPERDEVFSNASYSNLLKTIRETIKEGQYSVSENPAKRNILRIAILSLGSALWLSDSKNESYQDLLKFFYQLRALLRYSYAIGVVTVPVKCFDDSEDMIQRIEHMSDIAIRLESFAGSQKETNPLYKDYQGLLHLQKMLALNTIAPHDPDCHDFVFKVRRKKFAIEVLHLPPDLEDTTQREQDEEFGCSGQSKRNLLDF